MGSLSLGASCPTVFLLRPWQYLGCCAHMLEGACGVSYDVDYAMCRVTSMTACSPPNYRNKHTDTEPSLPDFYLQNTCKFAAKSVLDGDGRQAAPMPHTCPTPEAKRSGQGTSPDAMAKPCATRIRSSSRRAVSMAER